MTVRNTEWGAFLNLGRDYPSEERFAVVLWDRYVDPIANGSVICAEGVISSYEGVAQIELGDAEQFEV